MAKLVIDPKEGDVVKRSSTFNWIEEETMLPQDYGATYGVIDEVLDDSWVTVSWYTKDNLCLSSDYHYRVGYEGKYDLEYLYGHEPVSGFELFYNEQI